MRNAMVMFTFSVFDCKYPFWANLAQKFKVLTVRWNFVHRLILIPRNQWGCLLFLFTKKNTLSRANLVPKFKIACLKWDLVPRLIRICRIQWRCSLRQFSTENTSMGKFEPKIENCHCLVSTLIRICHFQWWCSRFSALDQKCPFWANLVQNIKIVSSSRNLACRLILVSIIQRLCSICLFLTGNSLFGQIWSKTSKLSV